jgi:hypothetical protein
MSECPSQPHRRLLRLLLALGLATWVGLAWAQPAVGPLVVPSDLAERSDDGVTVRTPRGEVRYLAGLGWTDDTTVPAPIVDAEGRVRLSRKAAAALGLPHLAGVRTGLDGATTRLVLDFGATEATSLEVARRDTSVAPDRSLELALPGVLLPDGPVLDQGDLRLTAVPAFGAEPARLRLTAPAAEVTVFPLSGPTRLVVDLVPLAPRASLAPGGEDDGGAVARSGADEAGRVTPPSGDGPSPSIEPLARTVAPGVLYRTFGARGREGGSRVHLIEIAPGAAELRVVGRSGEGRTVADWADGGVAAINAGYFDPEDFDAIGLRRVGGTLLSWPSRGRAVVGFGPDGTVIARAGARVRVRVDGRVAADARATRADGWDWARREGDRIGSPRTGTLVLAAGGRVVSNGIGPATVPAGGAALSYDPSLRALARVEPGQRVDVGVELTPPALDRARWAVEGGPLLVQDGGPAFAPDVEGFARGQRILDEATQQAALGVRADGSVLLLVAERMVAEDLVAVFLALEAEAAMRLDSGSSATLVAEGRALNRLLSRRVESAIVAVPAVEAGDGR